MLYIEVPYKDKDEAKALGARWDLGRKSWYIENPRKYPRFEKWIPTNKWGRSTVICDYFYIVAGEKECARCGYVGNVIVYGLKNTVWIEKDKEEGITEFFDEGVHFVPNIYNVPKETLNFMRKNFGVKTSISDNGKISYRNVCRECGKVHSKKSLLNSFNPPFMIYSHLDAEKLKLYRIPLKEDIVTFGLDKTWFTTMDLVEEYAQIINVNYGQF